MEVLTKLFIHQRLILSDESVGAGEYKVLYCAFTECSSTDSNGGSVSINALGSSLVLNANIWQNCSSNLNGGCVDATIFNFSAKWNCGYGCEAANAPFLSIYPSKQVVSSLEYTSFVHSRSIHHNGKSGLKLSYGIWRTGNFNASNNRNQETNGASLQFFFTESFVLRFSNHFNILTVNDIDIYKLYTKCEISNMNMVNIRSEKGYSSNALIIVAQCHFKDCVFINAGTSDLYFWDTTWYSVLLEDCYTTSSSFLSLNVTSINCFNRVVDASTHRLVMLATQMCSGEPFGVKPPTLGFTAASQHSKPRILLFMLTGPLCT